MATDFHNINLDRLAGLGEKTIQKLNSLGIYTCFDLLLQLPKNYEDRSRIVPISQLEEDKSALIVGKIVGRSVFGRQLSYVIGDATGQIKVILFKFFPFQLQHLVAGQKLQVYAKPKYDSRGRDLQLIHPEYKLLSPQQIPTLPETFHSIYVKHEILKKVNWHKLIDSALALLHINRIPDYLENLVRIIEQNKSLFKFDNYENDLVSIKQLNSLTLALKEIHHPPLKYKLNDLQNFATPSQQRLIFDELLSLQAALALNRLNTQQLQAHAFNLSTPLIEKFEQALPFSLTGAQEKVISQIFDDLASGKPMNRLLQGDVGSGKTLVCAYATAAVVAQDYQVVIMAPTELLIHQHYYNFKKWFEPLGIEVCLLTGKLTAKQQKAIKQDIAEGKTKIILGTHALFQEGVSYSKIGLLIVDEQHRFGVAQRLSLYNRARANSQNTSVDALHQLSLSATPIPRTMAMALFGNLNQSVIDELPPGRKPIKTLLMAQEKRQTLQERIVNHIKENNLQAYWVCPLIEDSDFINAKTVMDVADEFSQFSDIRYAVVHGKLKTNERLEITEKFANQELDLLIATTVIEVGIDVPNASMMVIDNAERMGMAQLHQLRGRVGRGSKESWCVLLYQEPISQESRNRLEIMRNETDGFVIAEEDLKARGAGEWLGTKQTGSEFFRICQFPRDYKWLIITNKIAEVLAQLDPKLCQEIAYNWYKDKTDFSKF